tara:strand:+ start:401 stop:973 length:573 start_codon:yes stop_codon:yes gene_type:complete
MIYDVIDDLMPKQFNDYMINQIIKTNRWRQSISELHSRESIEDSGMVMLTFPNRDNDHIHYTLNVLNDVILDAALTAHSSTGVFHNIEVDRYMFNLYNKTSICGSHQDVTLTGQNPGQYLSTFIYTFSDGDGYNIVADEKIESKAGRCILFSSYDSHVAYPPTNTSHRYTLNCQFKYTSYERFNDSYGTG